MRDNEMDGIFHYKFIDFGLAINIEDCSNFIENKNKKGLKTRINHCGTKGYWDENMYTI